MFQIKMWEGDKGDEKGRTRTGNGNGLKAVGETNPLLCRVQEKDTSSSKESNYRLFF